MKEEIQRLRAEIKIHEAYKRDAGQKVANTRGQLLQMARYHYASPDAWMPEVHKCDNPFKTCIYPSGSEWCIVCEEPYERK